MFRSYYRAYRKGFQPFTVDPQAWVEGRWDYLRRYDEAMRCAVLANFIKHFAPDGHILDVGCGDGVLADHLSDNEIAGYTGVDIAPAAVERARARARARAKLAFEIADACSYVPPRSFDAIVYNECLYYLPNPISVMRRHSETLTTGGIILCSCFLTPRTLPLIADIERAFSVLDVVNISIHKGLAWWVAACGKR
jgi:SAM-dependent methyltransferase